MTHPDGETVDDVQRNEPPAADPKSDHLTPGGNPAEETPLPAEPRTLAPDAPPQPEKRDESAEQADHGISETL